MSQPCKVSADVFRLVSPPLGEMSRSDRGANFKRLCGSHYTVTEGSHVEAEINHIAILYDIILALTAEQSLVLRRRDAPATLKVRP